MILEAFPMLETVTTVLGAFIVYTLRKTDIKIDKTASDLASHKLDIASTHATMHTEISREFATKLELSAVEMRVTQSNREVQLKLDRLIDRLIDNPSSYTKKEH